MEVIQRFILLHLIKEYIMLVLAVVPQHLETELRIMLVLKWQVLYQIL